MDGDPQMLLALGIASAAAAWAFYTTWRDSPDDPKRLSLSVKWSLGAFALFFIFVASVGRPIAYDENEIRRR